MRVTTEHNFFVLVWVQIRTRKDILPSQLGVGLRENFQLMALLTYCESISWYVMFLHCLFLFWCIIISIQYNLLCYVRLFTACADLLLMHLSY